MTIDHLPITIKTYVRSRSLKLRFCLKRHHFIVTKPPQVKERAIRTFLEKHAAWMEQQWESSQQQDNIRIGDTLTLLGKVYAITHDPLRKSGIFEVEDQLIVGGRSMETKTLTHVLAGVVQKKAHEFFLRSAEHYATQLGANFTRVTVRDTTSRWGSCSSKGALSFSWRLALAPLSVADYVAVHEVCHLKEMNHSAQFWSLVEHLCPNYQQERIWLRTHGACLHKML